jgi:3,4-dihydroxy 2-butanone 4-phosphate synthase/GTP cyclohydrolase II
MLINTGDKKVIRQSCAKIPTMFGEFTLCIYRTAAGDGHVIGECDEGGPAYGTELRVLSYGETAGASRLMVRVHSECFTGDVLGSLRCDCGDQLKKAMQMIAAEGRGVVIYMPQEGRGIGLDEKLKAYNLQDRGLDTVEANLRLGHGADMREYSEAALILEDMRVRSIRLLTNNPAKMDELRRYGVEVAGRIPVICAVNPFNEHYLRTKQLKMSHIFNIPKITLPRKPDGVPEGKPGEKLTGKPFVTLAYAQSLDGAIASGNGDRLLLSGRQSTEMTHSLRARNQAILVGIGTVLADDPQLTVRFAEGPNPQPVVLDGLLRLPTDSFLASKHPLKAWILAGQDAPKDRELALLALGHRIFRVPDDGKGRLDLVAVCAILHANGMETLMVEGGVEVIDSFLATDLVDRVVITISPRYTGGRRILSRGGSIPDLADVSNLQLGEDVVIEGTVKKHEKRHPVLR